MSQEFYISDSLNPKKRFFGRRKAKALSPLQQNLYDKAQDDFFFTIDDAKDIQALFADKTQKNILEIGFGGGEHLLHQAQKNPHINYLGIDAYVNSVSKAVRETYYNDLKNVRISDQDAFAFISALPANSLDGLYLLYPDPWPKRRHRNRRFVQRDTALLIETILKPNGFFRFASDIPEYAEWVIANLTNATSAFLNVAHKPNIPLENWTATRYEKKALREGRTPAYYEFFFK
ncbi:MAG: tRNA (guanine-N7-)-methyltransferase [Alphaproteobacteria bacterium]|jgi:tRNA (guanine-N7-)-methyltransferase